MKRSNFLLGALSTLTLLAAAVPIVSWWLRP
jgi:hypothetical protein